jgi:hypothetical protein
MSNMGTLVPKLNILPESQQLLWKLLGSTPPDFVLYGGTALALRLGHRQSVDFDFFSSRTFQPMLLARSVPYLSGTVPQRNETKDYLDIHALIMKADIDLSRGMASAAAIYGNQYNPLLTLQALAYFKDLPEPLSEKVKEDLVSAVKSVSLENLPTITASQTIGERHS